MSLPEVTITVGQVVESTIIYGFVHTFWMCTKWGLRHLESDTGRIIDQHVKAGHHARLQYCFEGTCKKLGVSLTPGTELDSLHQVEQE